jgi:GTP-binding protein
MLIDKVVITIKAGDGGKGAVSFRTREGNPKGGPDGGNGGNGGNVYVSGIDDLTALSPFQHKKVWKAEDGVSGKRNNLFGKNAEDLTIPLPIGTVVSTLEGKVLFEVTDTSSHLIVQGGIGGRGNNEFKSATNQTPRYAEKGGMGEEKVLQLELKLIAQIGLIGLPNVGKSTLLSLLTNAQPKIGNYPFTTLEPNVGMMDSIMLADIPGLIEGASEGKGLGMTFLKHIEKTELLVHCIDASSIDPLKDYKIIRQEFKNYNKVLLGKREIILLTKVDLVNEEKLNDIMKKLKSKSENIYKISVYDDKSVAVFKDELLRIYKEPLK